MAGSVNDHSQIYLNSMRNSKYCFLTCPATATEYSSITKIQAPLLVLYEQLSQQVGLTLKAPCDEERHTIVCALLLSVSIRQK